MNRKGVAATIVVVWLTAVGWLVKREYFQPAGTLLTDEPLNVSPGATYYRVTLDDVQIGFASTQVDTLADTVRVQDLLLLNVPIGQAAHRIEARTATNLSRGLELRSFNTSYRGGAVRFAANGTVADTLLDIDLETTDSRQSVRVPLGTALVLPSIVPMRLAFGNELAVGQRYTYDTFDPILLEQGAVTIRVLAESTFVVADSADQPEGQLEWIPARWDTVRAWRVEQRVGGSASEAWIDDLGQILFASTPAGYRLERTPYEMAYENFGRGELVPVLPTTTTPIELQTALSAGATIGRVRLAGLRLRLGGVPRGDLAIDGPGQRVSGDTIIIEAPPPDVLTARPYRIPNSNPALKPFREPSPLIQSQDPRIEAQARQIVGTTRSPGGAAVALARWVHEQIARRATANIANAVDALESRQGDTNEHTALYVALARAVGLPARPVAGLVLVNNRFYYQAWAEVYIEEWIGIDPMVGADPVDASYVRLVVDNVAHQLELLRRIGNISLTVLGMDTE